MTEGKYIVFEGIDGTGKTTQAKMLVDRLRAKNIPAVFTREPGSELIKDTFALRELILGHKKINPKALELLLEADRAEHTAEVKFRVERGNWIISDRSYISGFAYSVANGHSPDVMAQIMKFAIAYYPDVVFFLDGHYDAMVKRWKGAKTREEAHGREFFYKVYSVMKKAVYQDSPYDIAPKAKRTNIIIPAIYNIETIHKTVCEILGV